MTDPSAAVKGIRSVKGATVITLAGDIDLHHVPQIHPVLLREVDKKPSVLVIDLGDVGYMDSSGVGVLVQVFQRVKAYRGKLRLARMGPRVRSIFEITKLDKYFALRDSVEAALES